MNNDGERTLRSYSRPVNLAAVFGPKWATVRGDVFHVAEFMVRHLALLVAQPVGSVWLSSPRWVQTSLTLSMVVFYLVYDGWTGLCATLQAVRSSSPC